MSFCHYLFLFTSFFTATAIANPWANARSPANISAYAQSIGTYDNGCLSGAVTLPINGTGYQVMRLSRQRFFGHPDLKETIEIIGQQAANQHLGMLLVGDLGQVRGGPTPSGHRSHQNGLDVDIWFLLANPNRTLSNNERESLSATTVITGAADNINPHQWTRANEQVLQIAAQLPKVDRIFVNAGVKRELCNRYRGQAWLRKIRPWWKHDDHFHLRLKCPIGNSHCQSQPPLPAGDGCDASLAWWFSTEAKKPSPKPYKPKEPVLPALCQQVLLQ